jgi:hypothetical protein
MDFVKLKKACEDHAEVLLQYAINTTTDRETLKDMFSTVLCKFVKKETFYVVIGLVLEHDYEIEDIKKDWQTMLTHYLNTHTFVNNPEYTHEIIDRVKSFYKIKSTSTINKTEIDE